MKFWNPYLLWTAAAAVGGSSAAMWAAESESIQTETDESVSHLHLHLRKGAVTLEAADAPLLLPQLLRMPAASTCNAAQSIDDCRAMTAYNHPQGDDDNRNDGRSVCQWCVSSSIQSECMSSEQAALLPSGVFECSAPEDQQYQLHQLHQFVVAGGEDQDESTTVTTVLVRASEVVSNTDTEFCDSSSKSISGYMDLKNSQYDQNGEDKHLFFWMFEKRASASSSSSFEDESNISSSSSEIPFVVWLTGGPGCSSTLALLTENGPCSVNEDGKTTTVNPYSWTEAAHVLWLDQPAGVGFSYGSETDSNEDMVAEDAYYFLQAFFATYPEYKANPLFIIGESYAGHYVPAIAHRIYTGNQEQRANTRVLPLSGFAIGNGLTNPELQYPWYPEMVWNNSHHIQVVPEEVYDGMKKVVPHCTKLIHACNAGDGTLSAFACQSAFVLCNIGLTTPFQATGLNPYDIRIPCESPPLCYDMSYIEHWLNLESTKQALHIDMKHSHAWQSCNYGINMQFHTDWMKDFSPYVADLLNHGVPGLMYAGDVDFICNYLGNQAWTLALEWDHQADFKAAPVQDWNNGKGLSRTAGGLTFLQVFDAGHMVPKDQPQTSLEMLKQFLAHQPF